LSSLFSLYFCAECTITIDMLQYQKKSSN